jgi:hypothetical protein
MMMIGTTSPPTPLNLGERHRGHRRGLYGALVDLGIRPHPILSSSRAASKGNASARHLNACSLSSGCESIVVN